MKKKKIIIKRIDAKEAIRGKTKKINITLINRLADKLKKAVEKDKKSYGLPSAAC